MRILFVNRMLSMERGGGETFDLEIAKHLQQLGCEISFLSGIPIFSGSRIANPFSGFRSPASSFTLRSPYFGWFPWDRVKGGWRLRVADFWMFERRAMRWALRRQDQFDVIQVCELPTFVAEWKRRCRVPVVMRLTAPNYMDRAGAIRRADAVIASGETVTRVRAGDRPDCVDVPNAVDAERFKPQVSDFRRGAGIAADEFVVLYVARFQDFKNHRLLVDAFFKVAAQVPRSRLVLAGSGPLRRRIEQQVLELGLAGRVIFLGEVPFAQLPDIYAAADVKAISSDFESFCFAALEAMAAGLPLVTTDCGWVPALIGRTGSVTGRVPGGIVVPLRDAGALSEALAALARDPALRAEMGVWNRQRAMEQYGWDASAHKLMDIYKNVLAKVKT
jgi:glycosyltransferase involved in cell wall biosynthesis